MGFHITDSRSIAECKKDHILLIMSNKVEHKLHEEVKAVMTLSSTIKCRHNSEERTEAETEIEIETGEIYREQRRARSSEKEKCFENSEMHSSADLNVFVLRLFAVKNGRNISAETTVLR